MFCCLLSVHQKLLQKMGVVLCGSHCKPPYTIDSIWRPRQWLEWQKPVLVISRWGWPFDPGMWSHKLNDSTYSFEVAIALFSGLLCWIYGPDMPNKEDNNHFCKDGGLAEALEDWDCVKVDQGY
jgi:hypothetical protein